MMAVRHAEGGPTEGLGSAGRRGAGEARNDRVHKVVPERKVFLSRKKLVYRALGWVDEEKCEVHLSESLTETSSGLPPESGLAVKRERYRTRVGPRAGDIAEQAKLFGKVYSYTFDFASVRAAIERLAQAHGYTVHHHLSAR